MGLVITMILKRELVVNALVVDKLISKYGK